MKSLREHVAQVIAEHTECGGPDLLTRDETAALMRGAFLLDQVGEGDRANMLRNLAVDLGVRGVVHPPEPLRPKVNNYYLKSADVVIGAYDHWLNERQRIGKEIASQPPATHIAQPEPGNAGESGDMDGGFRQGTDIARGGA